MPDFFLDESSGLQTLGASASVPGAGQVRHMSSSSEAPASSSGGSAGNITDPELAKTFTAIRGLINADLVKGVNAVYVFDLKGSMFLRC